MPLNNIIEPILPESPFGVVVVFAIIIAFCEVVAQSSMKYYAMDRESRSELIILVGVAGYIMVALLLLTSYRYEDMGHMNMTWSCLSIIMAYAMGFLLFSETINHYTLMSVALALSAIYVGHLSDAVEVGEPIELKLDTNCD